MYTDISTVVFNHIVLNDGQWSVGFVLDSNALTDPSGVIKDIMRFNNRKRCRKEGIDFDLEVFQPKDNEEGAQTNSETHLRDVLVYQQSINSLQERLLELESEQGRMNYMCELMKGWMDSSTEGYMV